jgi:ArsR family transcriptional regulator
MRHLMRIIKALADTNRVRIVLALDRGPMCVCEVIELLGLAPSTVSKHLAVLDAAGLIESRKQARWVYYRLADSDPTGCASGAIAWLRQGTAADPHLRDDARRLAAIRKMDRTRLCRHYRSGVATR